MKVGTEIRSKDRGNSEGLFLSFPCPSTEITNSQSWRRLLFSFWSPRSHPLWPKPKFCPVEIIKWQSWRKEPSFSPIICQLLSRLWASLSSERFLSSKIFAKTMNCLKRWTEWIQYRGKGFFFFLNSERRNGMNFHLYLESLLKGILILEV